MRLLLLADASRQWEPAAAVSARIAQATQGHVTVLTAERIKRRQQEILRRAETVLGLPKQQVELRAQGGLVEQVVPEIAGRGAHDLLVMGPLGGLDWLTHGHIVSRLVGHARINVLLARGSPSLARALVATEGSEHGFQDLDAALALADVFGMEVHVLHVLSQIALYDFIKERPAAEFLDSTHPMAQHLREMREAVAARGHKGDAKVRVGPVQEEILAELRDGRHDLLVIGAHAAGSDDRLLPRDVSGWLLRHCSVSTLVVRDALPAAGRR